MKYTFPLLALCCLGCTTMDKPEPTKVRVTFYHGFQDKWGTRVACPETPRAKQGVTVAADPSLYPFGSEVEIECPNLEKIAGSKNFIVQDRGSAVVQRKASNGKEPVIDVFLDAPNRNEANKKLLQAIREVPDYLYAYISPPKQDSESL